MIWLLFLLFFLLSLYYYCYYYDILRIIIIIYNSFYSLMIYEIFFLLRSFSFHDRSREEIIAICVRWRCLSQFYWGCLCHDIWFIFTKGKRWRSFPSISVSSRPVGYGFQRFLFKLKFIFSGTLHFTQILHFEMFLWLCNIILDFCL